MKALLVIDIQKGYIEKYNSDLLLQINKRIQKAVEDHELIVYIMNIKKLKSGKVTNELANNLIVLSTNIFYKEHASAFTNEKLIGFLRSNHISELEIVGIDGNVCVAKSASDAVENGFIVHLLLDCIGIQNIERFTKTRTMLEKKGILFDK